MKQMVKALKKLNPGKTFCVNKDYEYQSARIIYGDCPANNLVIPKGYCLEENLYCDEIVISTKDKYGAKIQYYYYNLNDVSWEEVINLMVL